MDKARPPAPNLSASWRDPAVLTLVALIAAHTLCTVAYHLAAKLLGVSLEHAAGNQSLFEVVLDPRFWGLVVIELGSFGLWMLILARIDLSRAFLLTAISYCLIMALGALLFHERVGWTGYLGSAMILGGIVLVAGAGDTGTDHNHVR